MFAKAGSLKLPMLNFASFSTVQLLKWKRTAETTGHRTFILEETFTGKELHRHKRDIHLLCVSSLRIQGLGQRGRVFVNTGYYSPALLNNGVLLAGIRQ